MDILKQIAGFLALLIELLGGVLYGSIQLMGVIPSSLSFLGGALVGLPPILQSVVVLCITLAILKILLPGKLGADS